MGLSIAVWTSLFGLSIWVEYGDAYNAFWSDTETGKHVSSDPQRPDIAVPPDKRNPFKEFGGERINPDFSKERETGRQWIAYVQTLPLATRIQARVYGAEVGALKSLDKLRAEALLQPLVKFYFFFGFHD